LLIVTVPKSSLSDDRMVYPAMLDWVGAQTFGVLAPHEADRRNHLPDPGVDGAPAVFGLTTAASKV
jgi:hypothetical protein